MKFRNYGIVNSERPYNFEIMSLPVSPLRLSFYPTRYLAYRRHLMSVYSSLLDSDPLSINSCGVLVKLLNFSVFY